MAQNGPNDQFGRNDLIPNWILAFARPKWTKMVHFGAFRSVNRTLAIPDNKLKALSRTFTESANKIDKTVSKFSYFSVVVLPRMPRKLYPPHGLHVRLL